MMKQFGSVAALVAMAGFSGAIVGCQDEYGSELEETSVSPIEEGNYGADTGLGDTYGETDLGTNAETDLGTTDPALTDPQPSTEMEGFSEMQDQPVQDNTQPLPPEPGANQPPVMDQQQSEEPLIAPPPTDPNAQPQQQPAQPQPLPPAGQ